jgi:3-dehydroquinate synthase
MRSLEVRLGKRSYPIHIAAGLLSEAGKLVRSIFSPGPLAVISHPALRRLYGEALDASLTEAGMNVHWIEVPQGEKTKSLSWASFVYDRLVELQMERSSPIFALGGGVIGDLSGFVAATYLRGVPFVQMPTTLLAQVDSSIGGKTGVNHPGGKNLIGAFYQPRLVLIDTLTLKTLPERELKSGLSEIVKYGVIWDGELFSDLESHPDEILALMPSRIEEIIYRSCAIKALVVERDENEEDVRSILNFGHTLGHAIEATTGYSAILHGEAVSVGMVAACRLSLKKGFCSDSTVTRVKNLLARFGLPTELDRSIPRDNLVSAMTLDKKAQDGLIKFVGIEGIGRTRFVKLRPDDVLNALEEEA